MEKNNKLLADLALAMVNRPRASLQELAKSVGIAKATLYRFCRTRDELILRLIAHGNEVFDEIFAEVDLKSDQPLETLRQLITLNLRHQELMVFILHYWRDMDMDASSGCEWEKAMDTFFLNGQQKGVFRIDIPAPAMTELWGTVVIGLVDAERRGRIAKASLPSLIESVLLKGIHV